jgi:hypothetical protein
MIAYEPWQQMGVSNLDSRQVWSQSEFIFVVSRNAHDRQQSEMTLQVNQSELAKG